MVLASHRIGTFRWWNTTTTQNDDDDDDEATISINTCFAECALTACKSHVKHKS